MMKAIVFSTAATRQWVKLTADVRRRIDARLAAFAINGTGDVKRLRAFSRLLETRFPDAVQREAERSDAPLIRDPGSAKERRARFGPKQPGSRFCSASLRAALRPEHVMSTFEFQQN